MALLDRLDRMRGLGANRVRVVDALDLWADLAEVTGLNGREPVAPETAQSYRSIVRNKLRPIVANKMLGDVDARYVAWLRNELLDRFPRGAASVAFRRFGSCLSECKVLGIVDRNVAEDMTIRMGGCRKPIITIPSGDEALALLRATDRLASSSDRRTRRTWTRYRPIVYLLRFTGMRISEILGLPWHAINAGENCISIVQAVDRRRQIGMPKTDMGFRTIYASPRVIDLLRRWRVLCPSSPQNLVFPGRRGRAITPREFGGAPWLLLSTEAGLLGQDGNPRFRRHDFRHRLASEMIDLGATIKELQVHLGHSSPEVTLRYYGHLLSDRDMLERRRRRIRLVGELNWPHSP